MMTGRSVRVWQVGCIALLVLCGGWLSPAPLTSAEEAPILYLFWGDGCPHCEKEKKFLEELHGRYPALDMRWFELWKHPEFLKLADDVRKAYNIPTASVPMTFLGEWSTVGYRSDDTTGIEIEERVAACLENGCPDALEQFSEDPIVQRIRSEAAQNSPVNWQHFPTTLLSQEQ